MSVEDMVDREIDRLHDEIEEYVALIRDMRSKLTGMRELVEMAQKASDRLPHKPVAVVHVDEVLYILDGGEFPT